MSPAPQASLQFQLNAQQQPVSLQSHWQHPSLAPLLHGCDPNQLQQRLGLIYRQCSEAQRWAAVSALEQQHAPDPATLAAREQALALEWLNEHRWQLWRIAQLLLPAPHDQLHSLMMHWRQQWQTLQQQCDPARYQHSAQVKPARFTATERSDPLQQASWQQQLWQPLCQFLHSEQAAELNQWHTPVAIMQQWESGAIARQWPLIGSAEVITFTDRLTALWQESQQAIAVLMGAQPLLTPNQWQALPAGIIPAARGQLHHQAHWHSQAEVQLISAYQITIPTEGILTSIATSLDQQWHLERWPSHWQHTLPLWLHSHSPCLDIQLACLPQCEPHPDRQEPPHA